VGLDQEGDVAWVRAAAAGDQAAFGRLHGRYAPLVHSVLLARVPRGETEDLVQEVFMTAWRRLSGLRAPEAFGSWLAQIARNRAIDHLRRARRPAPLPDGLTAAPSPPSAEAEEALAAIQRLPEAYRETLLLRLVEGWTGPEIAARTGKTPGSVRVNLHRGMQLLREALGEARR
jgi:RNA polymerase sigma-70 factor (ECF subfamily)